MCGIAGLWNFSGKPADAQLLRGMAISLRHRGPDAEAIHTDGAVGLAHARLSIIDVAAGAQPMSSNDGVTWITFNGEIFNFVELAEQLRSDGLHLRTSSD